MFVTLGGKQAVYDSNDDGTRLAVACFHRRWNALVNFITWLVCVVANIAAVSIATAYLTNWYWATLSLAIGLIAGFFIFVWQMSRWSRVNEACRAIIDKAVDEDFSIVFVDSSLAIAILAGALMIVSGYGLREVTNRYELGDIIIEYLNRCRAVQLEPLEWDPCMGISDDTLNQFMDIADATVGEITVRVDQRRADTAESLPPVEVVTPAS